MPQRKFTVTVESSDLDEMDMPDVWDVKDAIASIDHREELDVEVVNEETKEVA